MKIEKDIVAILMDMGLLDEDKNLQLLESLTLIDLVTRLEKTFGISIPIPRAYRTFTSVDAINQMLSIMINTDSSQGKFTDIESFSNSPAEGCSIFAEDLRRAITTHDPDVIAFVMEDELPPQVINYGQFTNMISNLQLQLRSLGVGVNQVVPMLVERTPEAFALMVAIMLEGAAFSMLNPKLPFIQLQALLDDISPVGLVVDKTTFIFENLSETQCASLQPIILNSSSHLFERMVTDMSSYPVLDAAKTEYDLPKRKGMECAQGAVVVAFTSGSTGKPKGVLLSGESLAYHISNQIKWGLTSDDSILFPVTLAHNFGRNLLFSCLFVGASIHLTDHFIYSKWVDIVHRSKITGITSLLQYWTVVNHTLAKGTYLFGDYKKLRFVHIGGQRISDGVLGQLRDILGPHVQLLKSYGQTETGGTSAILFDATNRNHGKQLDSVGKAVPGADFMISTDRETQLKANEVGEVVYIGAGIFMGYLADQKLTQNKIGLHPTLADTRVLYTGDMGYLDEEGYLYILGRADLMFKTHGYRVLPSEIEDALLQHPGVNAAMAFGLPDQRLGDNVVVAVVEASDGTLQAGIQSTVSALIPRYMVPKDIMIVASLPTTHKGKLARAEIKRNYLKHVNVPHSE